MDLSKFRLSSLVVVTTGAGFICAGVPIDVPTMSAACIGTMLCAASAGTFNQVSEIQQDSNMKRTLTRPLPAGIITPTQAKAFGLTTGLAGTSLLLTATNPVVAALGVGNIALYAGAYTYSKRHTELNTWIGALVGAIPPVMGWAAATGGSIMALEPAALGTLLFLWQFPHFFALSWLHRDDYARGNFQMVAVNDPVGMRSANLIMEYSLYLTAFPILMSVGGLTSYMFAFEGTMANLYLLSLAHKFRQNRTNAGAKRIFLCSLWYLPVLLTGFVFHSRMWDAETCTDGATDTVKDAVIGTKEKLRGLCIHEMIDNAPNLCPKVVGDAVTESATKGIKVTAAATAAAADATKTSSTHDGKARQ